ncbi:MAG: hypothetical protein Kow0042_21820 [Calditrichia bacterium]
MGYHIIISIRKAVFGIFLLLIFFTGAFAQNHLRILTYNLLNYPGNDSQIRNPYFRAIVGETAPDIFIGQEMMTPSGVQEFLDEVLNYDSLSYSPGAFIFQPGIGNNVLYYKFSKIKFVSNSPIPTGQRDINLFRVIYKPTGDTLQIFAVHLKAGDDPTAVQIRAAQADSLRKFTNQLPAGTPFVVCGDFNIYGSSEPAFQKLVQVVPGVEGHVIDPLNLLGTWHNNPTFAAYHTQSTRIIEFGGGAPGGLDDRFDMILFSEALLDTGAITYIPNSYLTFGNDGLHFNDSINKMPNYAVPPPIAEALYQASDHLPVLCRLNFGGGYSDTSKLLISEFVVTPTSGEFIEIFNPNSYPVDLSNYYLTDATYAAAGAFYYNIVTGSLYGGGGFADFHARFPDGAIIQPGEYQTIALAGDLAFYNQYGLLPTYELYEDGNAFPQDVPDMREAAPGSINGQGGLTNNDEVIILYQWDGISDLVQDVDYVIYDDAGIPPDEAVDKTGVRIDGPDPDSDSSAYLPDTPVNQQKPAPAPAWGYSCHRIDFSEGTQIPQGGNGITGADETSENLNLTFTDYSLPSPNQPWNSPAYSVFGTVLLEDPPGSLAGTVVTLMKMPGLIRSDTTDASGFYEFSEVDSGWYRINFQRAGYRNLDSTIYVASDLEMNVLLLKSDSTTFSMNIHNDWNLLALPAAVSDPFYLSLFPNAIPATLFGWNGSYSPADSLEVGRGYWLRFPAPDTVAIQGFPVYSLTINLLPGWNMIGALSTDIALSQVHDPAGIIVPGTLFGFDGAYYVSDSLKQGRGYWIRAVSSGQIFISNEQVATPPAAEKWGKIREQMPALIFRDARGASGTLYFKSDGEPLADYMFRGLPPLPPVGAFDVRFEGDLWVASPEEAIIHLQGQYYPIEIVPRNFIEGQLTRMEIQEIVEGRVRNSFQVLENPVITITDPRVRKLRVTVANAIPEEFMVFASYPNPFNATTRIRYRLKSRIKVEVKIYDTTGRILQHIQMGQTEAGEHELHLNMNAYASGVYFVQLSAGQHTRVTKIVLMK